jgi:hypothetical protein
MPHDATRVPAWATARAVQLRDRILAEQGALFAQTKGASHALMKAHDSGRLVFATLVDWVNLYKQLPSAGRLVLVESQIAMQPPREARIIEKRCIAAEQLREEWRRTNDPETCLAVVTNLWHYRPTGPKAGVEALQAMHATVSTHAIARTYERYHASPSSRIRGFFGSAPVADQ